MTNVAVIGGGGSTYSGAAVLLDELARAVTALAPDEYHVTRRRTAGVRQVATNVAQRFRANPWKDVDVAVVGCSPFPPVPRGVPSIYVIFDLRWRWARGPAANLYRWADLRRAVRRSDAVFAISGVAQSQAAAVLGRRPDSIPVLPMGPGQFEGHALATLECDPGVRPRDPDLVVLTGGGSHKRNREAIELLSRTQMARELRLALVSVDREVVVAARQSPFAGVEVHEAVGVDTLYDIYRRAGVHVFLGVSEGFGFPFLEAAAAGCPTICSESVIAREVLGDCLLVADTTAGIETLFDSREAWPSSRALVSRATTFTWDDGASTLIEAIRRLV